MVLFWINMNHPSLAFYNFDGYEITWMAYGKIHGDLYVAGGHGLDATPYTEVFSIPPGNEVIWAEALIGVWGGNEYNTGWIETHVNGSSLGIQNINALNDQNSNILGSTNGVYLVHYNVTSHIDLNKSLDITVNTGGIFDGRVYGIVLLAVLNNSNNVTKFCIGFGNTGLHHMILGRSHDQFSFNIQDNYNKSEFQSTELIVSYLTGTLGENDYLFFNENLLSSDAGNEGAGGYFDFDSYDVLSYVTESNTVRFHRGDETYIHPTLSILKATYNATLGRIQIIFIFDPI